MPPIEPVWKVEGPLRGARPGGAGPLCRGSRHPTHPRRRQVGPAALHLPRPYPVLRLAAPDNRHLREWLCPQEAGFPTRKRGFARGPDEAARACRLSWIVTGVMDRYTSIERWRFATGPALRSRPVPLAVVACKGQDAPNAGNRDRRSPPEGAARALWLRRLRRAPPSEAPVGAPQGRRRTRHSAARHPPRRPRHPARRLDRRGADGRRAPRLTRPTPFG